MFDWSNLAAFSPSKGPAGRHHEPALAELEATWNEHKESLFSGKYGFFNAPTDDALSQARAAQTLAQDLRATGKFTDCVFLGIGGSALGPISLLAALAHRRDAKNSLRFHFFENPDPMDWTSRIRALDPAFTLVCVVTKSGTTFETMALFLLALEWLGPNRWQENVVAITDPENGDLRHFCKKENLRTLEIAPSVGGRFSVFTPVGLFPLALAGHSVEEFLAGARSVQEYVKKTPPGKNPLFLLASHFIAHFATRPIHVCMPYSTPLRGIGNWWVQLWSESLGKNGKGFSPIAAVGPVDQHSLLQLLRDGPDDKITLFLTVDDFNAGVPPVKIPALLKQRYPMATHLNAFTILESHGLDDLMKAEYRATSLVLTKNQRPNLTIQLDQLGEKSLGALYFALAVKTAFTGFLWKVNPFDQPGVEEGKVYIRDSLSRHREEAGERPLREWEDNSPVARLRRERPE
ncbi:MAG: glucose-6-phosphate isomerase [Bacteriovoracia bacterium]